MIKQEGKTTPKKLKLIKNKKIKNIIKKIINNGKEK